MVYVITFCLLLKLAAFIPAPSLTEKNLFLIKVLRLNLLIPNERINYLDCGTWNGIYPGCIEKQLCNT